MSLLAVLVGQTLDGKYRIEKQLGQGGMGAVYMATHIGTLRPVALKVIAPQFMAHPEFVERFRREAEAAGRLRHPNVVNVTDFGFAEIHKSKLAYLVMEYLDGCNLGDILKEEKRLPLSWVVDILEQTCLAVEKAHQQGIIHRDLKPDNIWLEPNERGGFTVKVLDFGLAKLALTASDNQIEGTLEIPKVATKSSNSSKGSSGKIVSDPTFQEAITNVQAVTTDSSDSEGQTAVQVVNRSLSDEEKTNIQIPISSSLSGGEEKTNIQPVFQDLTPTLSNIAEVSEEKTNIQPSPSVRDTQKENSRQTLPQEQLTQAGAILGTPLYMSPEQCLGEELDKRSDIYSLGIIAYEMLTGETPFSGNLNALIISHVNASPPPLAEKRPDIPKTVAELIMQGLSKKPEERPISVAAFASALRARSESAGTVVRQALGVYAENFSIFFQIGLLAAIPSFVVILLNIIQVVTTKIYNFPFVVAILFIFQLVAGLITLVVIQALNSGVFVPVLAQILLTPLKEVSLVPIWLALKKKIVSFLPVSILFNISSFFMFMSAGSLIGIPVGIVQAFLAMKPERLAKITSSPLAIATFLAIVLGAILISIAILALTIIVFLRYYLCGAVIIIEDVKGLASLKRSKALYKSNKKVTRPIIILYLTYMLVFGLIVGLVTQLVIVPNKLFIALSFSLLIGFVQLATFVLIGPLLGTCTALLYFKSRQVDGELLKDILAQYQPDALSISSWQSRIAKGATSVFQSLRKSKT